MLKLNFSLDRRLTALGLSLLTFGLVFRDVAQAAEKIFFVYTPLIASLKVESLEQFAQDGTVNQDLGFYLNLAKVDEEQKSSFREALTKPVQIDPILFARSLNTEGAERLLDYFGSVINIRGGSNGKYLLRGALIQAALEEELTLINVFKKLAVDIQVDVKQIIKYSEQVDLVIRGSELFASEIQSLANQESETSPEIDFAQKQDIRLPGSLEVKQSTLNLEDSSRNRKLYVNLYHPQNLENDNVPVIVLSHGLSSNPESFKKAALHLASYGYFVAVPQHPGSDLLKTQDFLEGYTREIFDTQEFIDRPQDITFVLDELTKLNDSQFQGKLNLESVGVGGHSFGGYTALAVAGAKLDFNKLENDCNSTIGTFNSALILQCRALKLERDQDYNFRDPRVKAVYAQNPVNASIFGQNGLSELQIPVFIGAGSYDPATPFVFEQGRTFPFIGSSQSYLQFQEGQAHVDFSELDVGITDLIESVGNLTLPTPDLLDSYTNSMLLAFFQVHLNEQDDYKIYLQPQYAQYISEGQEFKTYLMTQASAPELKSKYEQFIEDNRKLIFDE